MLAFSQARSGSTSAIDGYIGKGRGFVRAMVAFAETYADRTAEDPAALRAAVASGRIPVVSEEGPTSDADRTGEGHAEEEPGG